MIISAWWLRTSSKFSGKKSKKRWSKQTNKQQQMLKRWRTICNAVQDLTGLGFKLSTSGYSSKYSSSVIYKLAQCTKTTTVLLQELSTFNACLINVYGCVLRFACSELICLFVCYLKKANSLNCRQMSGIKKQCIENDNYKFRS